jgi:hypothetical protein
MPYGEEPEERRKGGPDRSSSDAAVRDEPCADSVIELRRELSRWNHPSRQEPSWPKDGEYEPSEWSV